VWSSPSPAAARRGSAPPRRWASAGRGSGRRSAGCSFTRSLLPCISLHALNNGIVTGVLLGWSWQVPLGALGAVAVALGLLAPFARERAPQAAPAA
jgi:hypothetical protein